MFPSTSLNECRLSNASGIWTPVARKHMTEDASQSPISTVNSWGLGHNLFSVGQFCDSNLEVAFRQHTCFIRNLEGVDLLTGSRGDNLYTLSLGNMINPGDPQKPIFHLLLLMNAGKSSKKPHKPKSEDTNQEKLYLLHMDLCGPMRVASVNGKKYILVIVDDYSRFTWVKCLRSKDEAPAFIINFLKMIQVRLKETVCRIRTDNGTERTRRIIKTIHVDFDELTAMASKHSSSGPALHDMTPVVAPEHAVLTGSPSSTTVDQDAPSPSNSNTTQETQTLIVSHDVEEDNHDMEVAHMGNDSYFGIPIPEVTSDQSSSSNVIHTIVPPNHQVSAHNNKWTKDHPLENIIGDFDRPVLVTQPGDILVKDGDVDDVDVHLYRSMIGSLMYLTTSRPDIMFAYSRDSLFELVAYTDSDYARATQDRKSTTRGCQFLRNRLISWQCKKQTVVATSTTEAEYVGTASCCGQVLWIQNQLLDYGYDFMNTVINIDNNSTICIIENHVQHSKTKHIEIRHHFIRDCNAKKLIQMVKIHTDYNVADLLTKGFDAGRFQYLVSSIGMLTP
ncbi:retrovirus-related pol polyprotein from transposon TNT 1-94 [Tanacetum coccineum]